MKYSIALLLALSGLCAASVLHDRRLHGKHDFMDVVSKKTTSENVNENMDETLLYRNKDTVNIGHRADRVFLERQKVVLDMLVNLYQEKNTNKHLLKLSNEFVPHRNIDKFHNQEAVIKFLKNYNNNNFLDINEVFTPTNQHHQNQAAQLFTFLHSAQDWETLKHAAAWAKDRFNKDQFVFSFSAAILNHPSTKGIVIPALYEIIPHAFVPATTLHKIYKAKLEGLKDVTVDATYTDQNRNNKNYNKVDVKLNEVNEQGWYNNKNRRNVVDKNVWSVHNPNSVFADNDGSVDNKAGVAENPENRLSYFTEDLGINDLHARFHIQNPVFHGINKNNNYFTSNIEDITKDTTNKLVDIKRGETFYFAHQQLLARYVLERLSNDLPIPQPVNFEGKLKPSYNPNLQHSNGQAVPARPPNTKFLQELVDDITNNDAVLPNNNQAQNPKVYERRLQEVAESGIVLNKDGTKTKLNNRNAIGILANLIAAPLSSLNPGYYGDYYSVAKHAIGNIVDPNNQNGVAPGAVSNYATAARDPAYYQLLVKMNQIFNNLKNKQGPYTKSELVFPGVKIEKVQVSDLVTFFETVKVNVHNALLKWDKNVRNMEGISHDELNSNDLDDNSVSNYHAKFQRLANKPFNYKLTVVSEKNTNAIVRIFLGPKYDSNGQRFTLPQASQYFVQLDQFKVKLHNGKNEIMRQSQESHINVNDPISLKELLKRVELARQGQQPLNVNVVDRTHYWGLPLRAQLPKGKKEGQQFVLYTIINAVTDVNNGMSTEDSTEWGMDDKINYIRRPTISSSEESSDELYNGNINWHGKVDSSSSSEEVYLGKGNKRHNNLDSSEESYINKVRNNKVDSSSSEESIEVKNRNNKIYDHRSIGYPFDRPIVDVNYNTANQYFKTVTVYHEVNNDN